MRSLRLILVLLVLANSVSASSFEIFIPPSEYPAPVTYPLIPPTRVKVRLNASIVDAVLRSAEPNPHYTFVDPATGGSVTLEVRIVPKEGRFTLLDDNTRLGIDHDGNGSNITERESVVFSAAVVSRSGSVEPSQMPFGVVALGMRALNHTVLCFERGVPLEIYQGERLKSFGNLVDTPAIDSQTPYSDRLREYRNSYRARDPSIYQFSDYGALAGKSLQLELSFDAYPLPKNRAVFDPFVFFTSEATPATGPVATAKVTVSCLNDSYDPISVNYTTSDGTASAGSDYIPTTGTLTWAPRRGDAVQRTFTIPILTDASVEPTESFTVILTAPNEETPLTTAEVVILADDAPDAESPPKISNLKASPGISDSFSFPSASGQLSGGIDWAGTSDGRDIQSSQEHFRVEDESRQPVTVAFANRAGATFARLRFEWKPAEIDLQGSVSNLRITRSPGGLARIAGDVWIFNSLVSASGPFRIIPFLSPTRNVSTLARDRRKQGAVKLRSVVPLPKVPLSLQGLPWPGLYGGDSEVHSFVIKAPEALVRGKYIIFYVDDQNSSWEMNESNNRIVIGPIQAR